MDREAIILELKRNHGVFSSLLKGLGQEEILWKPESAKWCLLEVACHLHDEEREDFRSRLKHVLENPELPLPSIDPVAWVSKRNYLHQDYETVVGNFLKERDKSISWLQSLENHSWKNVHIHPKLGSMSAEMLLANWLAHDYLHFRQISRLRYGWIKFSSGEDLSYAGEW